MNSSKICTNIICKRITYSIHRWIIYDDIWCHLNHNSTVFRALEWNFILLFSFCDTICNSSIITGFEINYSGGIFRHHQLSNRWIYTLIRVFSIKGGYFGLIRVSENSWGIQLQRTAFNAKINNIVQTAVLYSYVLEGENKLGLSHEKIMSFH